LNKKQKEKSEKEILQEISEKLDKIIGLIATQNKPRIEQLKILDGLGFSSVNIGKMLGIHDGTVRGMLFTFKKKKTKNKKHDT